MRLTAGDPFPLGASWQPDADAGSVNFAVWAPDAEAIDLCLFDARGEVEQKRLRLPACTDGVWHGRLLATPDQLAGGLVYGLRAHGAWSPRDGLRFNANKVLVDPWAQEVVGRYAATPAIGLADFRGHDSRSPDLACRRNNARRAVKARVVASPANPWSQPQAAPRLWPAVPREHTVIYEIHVKGATEIHPELPEAQRGCYLGLAHPAMLAHYRRLGVTSLCLLPVQARADEERLQQLGLTNYWGYSTLAYFAPEPRYASRPEAARGEFAAMVAGLHSAGLEVILDVVYNHTGESDAKGPCLSLRGLANRHYYRLDPADRARYVDWAGCGNTLNLAEPRVVELVLGSLRHWVRTYGIDGFRFDLASILGRGAEGHFNAASGFFAALRADPLLGTVKLIAEPWDVAPGGYQLGAYPPGWAEWNDQYRDTLRSWWLGSASSHAGGRPHAADRGMFAHRFAGSSAQFHHSTRSPSATINYITAHDGYTLRDVVSYQQRHNLANGEDNRDGHQSNHSWNCGVEGETRDRDVLQRRARLQRSMLACLLLAQGTPMLLAGDELGHSQGGNNNAYCQDNRLTWLDWSTAEPGLADCVSRLIALRRAHAALRPRRWLSGRADAAGWRDVVWWHPDGHELQGADWADAVDRAMALRLLAVEPEPLGAHSGQLCAATAVTMSAGMADAQPTSDDALLIVLNPLETPRDFVLPPGDWTVEFCSAAVDGVPAQAESAAALSALSGQSAAVQFARLPAHTLNVYSAPRASLGEPDVSPQALQRGFATAWPEPMDFSPTSAGSLFVDRRGEP
jgi:glycogen operon protein